LHTLEGPKKTRSSFCVTFKGNRSFGAHMRNRLLVAFFLLLTLLAPTMAAWAHTPLKPEGENDSLEEALVIPDPTKSWTLYRELHEAGEVEYFRLELREGERFYVSIYTPRNEGSKFSPRLVVMGPDIPLGLQPPEFVEVPQGYTAVTLHVERPERPEYEPFTPASYYYLASFDMEVQGEGVYYFAVFDPSHEGRYGVAMGYRETFTLTEWLLIPFDLVRIHQWEGQSLALILAPLILTLALGVAFTLLRLSEIMSPRGASGMTAGLLYIGTGLMTLMQMVFALSGDFSGSMVLTMVFVLLPLIFGVELMRRSIKVMRTPTTADRGTFVLIGALGLATWAGFLIGPTLAVLTGLLPKGR
jgi:hypothetical protein